MSGGAEIAIDVLLGLVKAAPAIGQVLGGLIGGSAKDVEKRLELARANIHDPRDPSATDAARRAELDRILGAAPPAIQVPHAAVLRADHVIGCERCGKPSALVDDVIPADGLCPWCRAGDAPGVTALLLDEQPIGARETEPPANPYGSE